MSESDRVLVEILVAAPIDTVWHALREPQEIRRWFGWEHADIAGEIEYIFMAAANRATASDRTLRFAGMPDRFALEAHGSDRTIVRLIRSAPATDVSWTGIYDDILEGWQTFSQHLRFTLERHRGADRRTLFLNGRAQRPGTPLPLEALGLGSLLAVGVGHRYGATTAFGETLEGTVWFRSAYQFGVTVDQYGDGLLIVHTRPTTEKSPHGGGMVQISTYGQSDEATARLRDRWATWWGQHYEVIEVQPAA